MTTTVEIDIIEHPSSKPDLPAWLAIVTTKRGRRYFVTYAGEKPSVEKVQQAWIEDRQAFDPYLS